MTERGAVGQIFQSRTMPRMLGDTDAGVGCVHRLENARGVAGQAVGAGKSLRDQATGESGA